MNMLLPIIFLIAIGVFIIAAFRPKYFWPLLIAISVSTAGLSVQGYALVDELFVGFLILGSFFVIAIGSVRFHHNSKNVSTFLHEGIFFLMVIYIILQSIRGLMLWEDVRITRWILYYAMLGIILFIASKKSFPTIDAKKTALIVTASALFYFVAYLVYGLYSEMFRGIGRFQMQSLEWSGSAYAVFPLIIAVPAAIMLFNSKVFSRRITGALLVAVGFVVGLYYDSRMSLIVILIFIGIAFYKIKIYKWSFLLAIFLIIFSLYFSLNNETSIVSKIGSYGRTLSESVDALWNPRESDLDRNLHFHAAFATINENSITFLFGYGVHSHHYVLRPYLQKFYDQYLSNITVGDTTRTVAFTALLVDTGWIGMILLISNFFILIYKVSLQKNNPMRLVFLAAIPMTFMWLLVSNIQDILLFYLLIMPAGIFYKINDLK